MDKDYITVVAWNKQKKKAQIFHINSIQKAQSFIYAIILQTDKKLSNLENAYIA